MPITALNPVCDTASLNVSQLTQCVLLICFNEITVLRLLIIHAEVYSAIHNDTHTLTDEHTQSLRVDMLCRSICLTDWYLVTGASRLSFY